MLTDITSEERVDKISSAGYAYGYIGSCIPFLIALVFVLFYAEMHLSLYAGMAIAILIIAIWWLVFNISFTQKL